MMERKRILLAALALLIVGAGLVARRWLASGPQGLPQSVVYSGGGSPRMSAVLRRLAALFGSGQKLTVGDLRAVLASAADDPAARRFAEDFMRDPELRKAWEAHRDEDPAKELAGEVAKAPQFGELLDRWQADPAFLAAAEGLAGDLEADLANASASSDRMLLRGAGASVAVAGGAARPGLAGVASTVSSYDAARFRSIFAMMDPEPRKRVLAELEQGLPVDVACARAGAAQACDAALRRCRADPDCEFQLNGLAPSRPTDRKNAIVRGEEELAQGESGEREPGRGSRPKNDSGDGSGGGNEDKPSYREQIKANQLKANQAPAGPAPTYGSSPPACFVAGTRVLTPAGNAPIETIRPGDRVLSMDLGSGELVAAEVVKTFRAEAKGLRRVTLSNGLELRVTEEHPFFDPDSGRFRRARELAAGDRIASLARAGGILPSAPGAFGAGPRAYSPGAASSPNAATLLIPLTVVQVEELSSEGVEVYNFHVGPQQNYFAEGILVHNRKVEDGGAIADTGGSSSGVDNSLQKSTSKNGMVKGGAESTPKSASKTNTTSKPKASPKGSLCFAAGTRILTPAGEVPIDTIRPGDTVLAADLRRGGLVEASVVETFKAEAKGLRLLTFSGGIALRVTEEHPFFDPESGRFRRVRELAVGDRVARLSSSGRLLPAAPWAPGGPRRAPPPGERAAPVAGLLEALTLVAIEELPSEGVAVYNLHVGSEQNYFAEGILVHNRKD